MMRSIRFSPSNEMAVIPASRARSVSGKRPETIPHVCAIIFRFTRACGKQVNPTFPLREANDIALTTFFRVSIPSASAFKVHNRPSPAF
jgi:hypothetical protein